MIAIRHHLLMQAMAELHALELETQSASTQEEVDNLRARFVEVTRRHEALFISLYGEDWRFCAVCDEEIDHCECPRRVPEVLS